MYYIKRIIIFYFVLLINLSNLFSQQLLEVYSAGGNGFDFGSKLLIDDFGNRYVAAKFVDTVDIELGIGVTQLISVPVISHDISLSKYDSVGNMIWIKQFGTNGSEGISEMEFDNNGDIFLSGSFEGSGDFDHGIGTFNISTVGLDDIFFAKINPNGDILFIKTFGSTNSDLVMDHEIDNLGNIYLTGRYLNTVDFDPSLGTTFALTSVGSADIFISKYDNLGNFIWANSIGGTNGDYGNSIVTDTLNNVYLTGRIYGVIDFDPGPGILWAGMNINQNSFVSKYDPLGNILWVKNFGAPIPYKEEGVNLLIDRNNDLIASGTFESTVDFDPDGGIFNMTSVGNVDVYILKLNLNGGLIWAKRLGVVHQDIAQFIINDFHNNLFVLTQPSSSAPFDLDPGIDVVVRPSPNGYNETMTKLDSSGNFIWGEIMDNGLFDIQDFYVDEKDNMFLTGQFGDSDDVQMGIDTTYLTSFGDRDIYFMKMQFSGIYGKIYDDINQDCNLNGAFEAGLDGRLAIINPGNIVVQTDSIGFWHLDSLPVGNYTITVDTTGNWNLTCPMTQSFSVLNSDALIQAPYFGFKNENPCAVPEISIVMPRIRECFSNQKINVNAFNTITSTAALINSYVDVELDSLIQVNSCTAPYTVLGSNIYRVNSGNLNPGESFTFSFDATVSCDVVIGQTLCMQANIFPADVCIFDSIPTPNGGGVLPCVLPYDNSNVEVESWCDNDSIYFTIENIGTGDMQCYSPSRIYFDGQLIIQDSFLLDAGDIDTIIFTGDGRTWRLEADQHPLHPGNSHPSTTIELCGNQGNWTSNLVNIFPMDDADPNVDIYCGVVSASFDPNDKTGYPLGITDTHFVSPNQHMEYVIRFQNTGTDTAFTVIVRDTLEMDFDIFSVVSGASSHNYSFTMHGTRVLEWTFNNIMLPDSTTNEEGSHGFVTFSVEQNPNLSPGTELNNEVGIYFDFNSPIITNTTSHVIRNPESIPDFIGTGIYSETGCELILHNGMTYDLSGTYFQIQNDSLFSLDLTVLHSSDSIMIEENCYQYVLNSQTYTSTGTYSQTLTNANGCDSLITLNLIINNDSDSTMNIISCNTYELNSQIYSSSGTFTQNLINSTGCDSLITLNLTINNVDSSVTQNNLTLTATTSGASYQWLDCNNGFSTILNATNQSFTPTINGSYAVSVTENGCTDTSACFTISTIGVTENSFGDDIRIYPNPSNGKLFIDLGMKTEKMNVSVKNAIGQIVYSESYLNKNILELNLNVERGIYFVELLSEVGSKKVFKIIID